MTIFALAAGLLGVILGSFLNALLFRYNTGRSALRGRSACMHCSHTLSTLDLVPILSFVALGGRCRYCKSRLSWQYPLVEAAGAALAVLVYLQNPEPLHFALWLCVWMTLLFITVYDLKHQIIPWGSSITLSLLALLLIVLNGASLAALAAGPLLAFPLFFISLISGGRWMGWGDGALELGLGWMLGLTMGFTAFVLAFWIGAAVGITLTVVFPRYTMKSEVPFAPFLILGAACAYFLNVDLFQTLQAFFV